MLELAGIIILGILAQWLAWRIKVPAILPLILTGLIVGPLSTLWMPDSLKLIEPVYDASNMKGLFPGKSLYYFVSLAIGIILFEGGLTLKRREIVGVGPVILKLITLGSLITFLGGGLAAHFIMGLSWQVSWLFGALIVVTGPTVIAPILQNVPLNRNVATVLKWEGILIDPIGALMAVLVFEFIRSSEGGVAITSQAFFQFLQILLIGFTEGTLAAIVLYQLIKREWIPHYLLNVVTLAFVLTIFVSSDLIEKESGLLSVVIMGMVLGNLDVPRLKDILSFKESLSVLLISILFILLAANIDMEDLDLIMRDWRSLALFGTILLLRPISVGISTWGADLLNREKLFISWMGPRGIVAAGIASLFGITLYEAGVPDAEFITPLVFMIVLGTVSLNATTARPLAHWLNVIQKSSEGILIVGANLAARVVAKYLQDNNRHVVVVDNNEYSIRKAKAIGLEAFAVNIYTDDLAEHFELVDMGYMIAMTSNQEVNNYAVRRYERLFGEHGTFRLVSPEELQAGKIGLPAKGIFSYTDDFLNLNEVARDYGQIHEVQIQDKVHYEQLMENVNEQKYTVPLFIKEPSGSLQVLSSTVPDLENLEEGYKLVYMGKKLAVGIAEKPEVKP